MTRTDLRAAITSAPMSGLLIALNVAAFAAITVEGRLLDVLALQPGWSALADQPWTLVTVSFASSEVLHLAVAVLVIGLFGPRFERLAGSALVLGVYLLAGLAGSIALVATAAATGFDGPSVGASAAFLGLVGALATSPREAWGAGLPVHKVVIVVLVIQVIAPILGIGDWVSSAAHTAGLAVGTASAHLLLRSRDAGEPRDARTGTG
jgi:membrane associated rhomboid family serine protease